MGQISEKHHFIPEGLLRNFCFENEQVYYYSKYAGRKGVHTRNIGSIFQKRHLNTFIHDNGTRDDSLEKFYARHFDDPVSALSRSLNEQVANGWIEPVCFEHKMFLVQFLYNHLKRSPDFHAIAEPEKSLDEILHGMKLEYKERFPELNDSDWNRITSDNSKKRILQNARVQVLARQSHDVLDALSKMNLVFATCNSKKTSFIVSSHPVVRMTNNAKLDLEHGDVELWATLTPFLAVGLLKSKITTNLLKLPSNAVRHLNLSLFQQSKSVAGRYRRQLLSIVNAR